MRCDAVSLYSRAVRMLRSVADGVDSKILRYKILHGDSRDISD